MSEPRIRILVVEDEPAIRSGLLDVLAFHGYEPTGVDNGDDGLREGLSGDYQLVLLDLMLPGISGFEVCEALRAELPRIPILMLTARGAEDDVLRGFACGSDDYVTKPFSISQLLARIEALLRRAGSLERREREPFACAGFEVDPERCLARSDAGEIPLTRREVDLLALLAREAGRTVTRATLLREVWGIERADRIETRTVDMHVAKLRKKLGRARDRIETVRGEGYRLAAAQ